MEEEVDGNRGGEHASRKGSTQIGKVEEAGVRGMGLNGC